MNLPQDKEGRTVRERLNDGRRLEGTIRAQSFYSYDQARTGYVERPYGAGGQWGQLAAALGSFDRSLSAYLDHRLDEQIEEGIALGQEAFNSPASFDNNGLRRDFKAWAEANPDQAGKNPFIVRGYEQSHLRQMGMEFQKALNDHYSTSGIRNETDPAKVDAALSDFTRKWYEEKGLAGYENKLMLAGNFSPAVAEGRRIVMQRHSNDLSAQNLVNIKTAFQQETAAILQNLTDTEQGGFNISHPDARQQATIRFGQEVAALSQELANNGYPEADIPAVILQMLESEASRAAEQGDEDMLDLCQSMLGMEINGVELAKLPGAAARMEQLQEAHSDKEWKRITRARQMRDWHREDQARATLSYALQLGQGREDINLERVLADNPKWTPEQAAIACENALKFRSSSYTDPRYNPQAASRLFEAHQRAVLGLDGPESVQGLFAEFGPHAEPVFKLLLEDSGAFSASHKDGLLRIGVYVAGLYDKDVKDNPDRYMELMDSGEGQYRFSQSAQNAINSAQAEFSVWVEEHREEGRAPTQAQVFLKIQEIQQRQEDAFRRLHAEEEAQAAADQKRREEEAKAEAARATEQKARDNQRIQHMAQQRGVSLTAPLKEETQARIGALLPADIPMPATQAELLNLLHTYYPAMSPRDFDALRLTVKGSIYDMGLMDPPRSNPRE